MEDFHEQFTFFAKPIIFTLIWTPVYQKQVLLNSWICYSLQVSRIWSRYLKRGRPNLRLPHINQSGWNWPHVQGKQSHFFECGKYFQPCFPLFKNDSYKILIGGGGNPLIWKMSVIIGHLKIHCQRNRSITDPGSLHLIETAYLDPFHYHFILGLI